MWHSDGEPGSRGSRTRSGGRMGPNLFILAILLPASVAMAFGEENFPLTSAAMFARDIGPERARYTMHWQVQSSSTQSEVNPTSLGLSVRHFFVHFYGPAEADSPYADTPRDASWPAFQERAAMWFGVFVGRYEKQTGQHVSHVRLIVRQRYPASGNDYLVGTYDAATRVFEKQIQP